MTKIYMFVNKKNNKILQIAVCALMLSAAVFLLANFVRAASPEVGLNYAAGTGLSNSEDIRVIVAKIIRVALGFLGIIAVGLIMYAGWLWMTSEGNEEKIEQAKKILKNAVIGLIIILSAFAIVSFVINQLTGAGGGAGEKSQSGGGSGYGMSAIENGAIQSVYPARGQLDVPRNTSIIVTFRQAVKPDGLIKDGKVNSDNVKIYKNKDSASALKDAAATASTDNKIFVFSPAQYLGSPSEKIWYTVSLTLDNIKKQSDGQKITNPWSSWNFEVSDKLDLTPPQVLKGGVFPPPDNGQDLVDAAKSTPARQAVGAITINADPAVYSDAVVKVKAEGVSGQAAATVAKDCAKGGDYTITIGQNSATSTLFNGSVLLGQGQGVVNSKTVSFSYCGLKLTLAQGNFQAGNSWTVKITAMIPADTVTVGGQIYTAGDKESQSAFKVTAGDVNATAKNLASVINANNPDVTAVANNNIITIKAKLAGLDGNSIGLATSDKNTIAVTEMKNGADKNEAVTVNGVPDVARNAVIRLDFNEAVNPLTVSGKSADVQNYIKVEKINDDGSKTPVAGNFIISNQYQTVEFLSDQECGVNACGEKIYCLPENSNLRVELKAAALADCGTDNCASRTPFNSCDNGNCQDAKGNKYPLSSLPLSGVADLANNSLDGNRDGQAQGPVSDYNENAPDAKQGDSFQWSFFTNDKIDLTPPEIVSAGRVNNASLSSPLAVMFKKLMMSASLMTGEVEINNGRENIKHNKLINLWNFANQPLGYWITNENLDSAADGVMDRTKAYINHTGLVDATSYRAQVGSGVKDIYQNCYKPSSGPDCAGSDAVSETNPSCCSGTAASTLTAQGNCQ